ncbi:hypothetical protein E4T56_gene5390 [Termitomyces sp. T112]|nr:hypothetical protein E4T56_gene5390 [Termitomyces sp. T112]
MLLQGLCVDEDIVKIYTNNTFSNQVTENVIHLSLEGGWAVGATKEHHQRFKESAIGLECCLPLITFFDVHIVVIPMDVQLGEVACTPKVANKFQGSVTKRPILFNNKDWRGHWRLRGLYLSRAKILL